MKELEFDFKAEETQKFEAFFNALHKHYSETKKDCSEIKIYNNSYIKFDINLESDIYESVVSLIATVVLNKVNKRISFGFFINNKYAEGFLRICNDLNTIKDIAIISNTFLKSAKIVSESVVAPTVFDFDFLIKTFENDSAKRINEMFE